MQLEFLKVYSSLNSGGQLLLTMKTGIAMVFYGKT